MADVRSSAGGIPEPGGLDVSRYIRQAAGRQLGYTVTPWPEFLRSLDMGDEAPEEAAARREALSDFLDTEDLHAAQADPDAGPAVRERRPGGGEARRQFDEDPVEDLRSSRGGYSAEVSDARSPHRVESFEELRAEALDFAVARRESGMAAAFADGAEAVEAYREDFVSREPSAEFVAQVRGRPGEPPGWVDGQNAPRSRLVHLGYRIVEADGSPHYVRDREGASVIDPRVFQDRDQALSAADGGQKVVPTVYSNRGDRVSYEAYGYRYAEPRLEHLAASGRFDPAAVAVLTGQSRIVYGSDPAPPSEAEQEFLSGASASHLALCYADPGRSEAVERDWRRSVDRLEAGIRDAPAPEDAREYVDLLRGEQDAQLPGWELARFVSRAHAALGRPAVVRPADGEGPLAPAFDAQTIEAVGECYPDLHAAARVLDPRSPLAHDAPVDHPEYHRRVAAAVDGLQAQAYANGTTVDAVDALATIAVVQERMLADPPAPVVETPSLSQGLPWLGPGSSGFEGRVERRLSALVGAVDAAGVPVTFSSDVDRPVVDYGPPRAGGSSAGADAPPPRLVLPEGYAAAEFDGSGASVSRQAADGMPVIDGRGLDAGAREELFRSVAMTLPTVLRDQPYPEDLAAAREAIYGGVSRAQSGAIYLREAEHFAARMEARVMEVPVGPPEPAGFAGRLGEGPAGGLGAQAGRIDIFAARMAAAGATALQVVADDVARDAERACAAREAACDRLQGDVLPALREAGVSIVVDPGVEQARYVPDPRPAREQRGPLRDSVVVPAGAVDAEASTASVVRQQAGTLQAVSLALGQRGRLDRPEARRVASQIAGRRSCPAAAQRAEAEVGGEFVRRQFKQLWPGGSEPVGASTLDGKRAGQACSRWVERAVEERNGRIDAALAAGAPGSRSEAPASRGSALAPIGARPAAPPLPTPAPAAERPR